MDSENFGTMIIILLTVTWLIGSVLIFVNDNEETVMVCGPGSKLTKTSPRWTKAPPEYRFKVYECEDDFDDNTTCSWHVTSRHPVEDAPRLKRQCSGE